MTDTDPRRARLMPVKGCALATDDGRVISTWKGHEGKRAVRTWKQTAHNCKTSMYATNVPTSHETIDKLHARKSTVNACIVIAYTSLKS